MDLAPPEPFDPEEPCAMVPLRCRDDGWTAVRQRAFLEELAACGSVTAAARSVGMSRESAYALRRRAKARAFAQTWDAARALSVEHLTETAWDRALEGELRPIFYHGERVGETRHFDNRLLLALIAQNRALLAEAGPQAALASPALVAAIAADWDAALDRAARGEPLAEPAPEPLAARQDAPENDASDLELGRFTSWWDDEQSSWLTNWPAPADYSGEWFEIEPGGEVLGPAAEASDWDPDDPGEANPERFARTLNPDEHASYEARILRNNAAYAARIEIRRRAAFGLIQLPDFPAP